MGHLMSARSYCFDVSPNKSKMKKSPDNWNLTPIILVAAIAAMH